MTPRAVLLGLLLVACLGGATYYNDWILRQTYLIGNHMPIAVYGVLVAFLLCINPLLARLGPAAPLRGKEIVLVMAMALAACAIPGSGLARTFSSLLMLPHHLNRVDPAWQHQRIIERVPEGLLASPKKNNLALDQFIQGMSRGDARVPVADVPWEAWTGAWSFWLPLLLVVYAGMLGLSLVVYRQWAHHEQLPYPLARFVNALLPEKPGLGAGAVMRTGLFWVGAGGVALIHLNNYACLFFPQMVRIPTMFDFTSVLDAFPAVRAEDTLPYTFRVYFSMVAIAYFLAADVGLAIGLAPLIYPVVSAFFTAQGVSLKAGGIQSPQRFIAAGGFFGIFLTLLYTGRHYYAKVARHAFFLRAAATPAGAGGVGAEAVWGARVFVVAMMLFLGALVSVGLDWQLAAIFCGIFVVFHLVLARLMAETGLFFFQPQWLPAAVILALLGARAVGPEAALILFLVSAVFMLDPREALMPFLANALRMLDLRRLSLGPGAGWMALALLVAMGIAIPLTLYLQYDRGAPMWDGWTTLGAPRTPFAESMLVSQRLDAQGLLTEDAALSGWARLATLSPSRPLLVSFVVGLGLVLLCSAGRLRFPRWPLHPICFVAFFSYTSVMIGFSFLLGWFIKFLVTKYGGEHGYHALKPLMFGLIAGELLGGGVSIATGWVIYLVTGEAPPAYSILPR
jgi:hypothetical protein